METDKISKSLLTKTLNFHGVQLQKIFETEYSNFSTLKLDSSLHFNEYAKRQKQLSIQDRGKRFRLQQFICKHANQLFYKHFKPIREDPCRNRTLDSGYFPILPPYESFLSVDKEQRLQRFFDYVKQGDIIAASVMSKTAAGMILKVLFGECEEIRCVPDVGIKAFCPTSALIAAVDKKTNTTRAFLINDLVCCEILEVSTDTEKIVCGMKGVHCRPESQPRLGLMHSDDFPIEYRIFQDKKKDAPYNVLLEKSESFNNPNLINNLMIHLGIPNELYTHFDYLKEKFPAKDCAVELRLAQAAKWAIRSVTDGIEHFKCGRFSEAYQCLNKALTIDPRSVEALVARGALYANSSNYEKAITDFENALKFNPNHQNAKKYLGDTLIAYGRTFEENGKFTEAINAYESCLSIIPNHEEASNSLQFIKNKMQALSKKDVEETYPDAGKIKDINDTLNQLLTQTESKSHAPKETKKVKSKSRRSSSSSSSSSSSNSSSDSSDDSSSSSGSSVKSKKKKNKSKKEISLSPLSKRMAMMEKANAPKEEVPVTYQMQPDNENEYELRVRRFLEETKKDDDYEEKVRKFLDETAKWKKKQKIKEEKLKRKKKEKKLKAKRKRKESKKKRKQMKEEKKRKSRSDNADEDDELLLPEKYLGLSSLKDLEELQSKLSAYYSKVEKNTLKSGKKDKHSNDKKNLAVKRKSSFEEDVKINVNEKNQRIDKMKPEMYSDGPVTEQKMESNSSKFKMQLNTVTNKVKKRSSEDPLWGEEKIISEVEINKPKSNSKSRSDRKEHRTERVNVNVEPVVKQSNSPPLMDKLGGFHIKKVPSLSPKHDMYPRERSIRGNSRSRSRSLESPKKNLRYRSRSLSRKRYSRSRSRSSSYQRGKYSRYSRSRSCSRSRSRSPYYRNRNYYPRGRGGGTYYKPRMQNYRGGFRSNWRNNYNGRSRGYMPRFRGNRRPYRNFRNRDDRDYRRYDRPRTPSDEEYWEDNHKERMDRRHSDSEPDHREVSYDEFCEEHDDLIGKSEERDQRKSIDRITE